MRPALARLVRWLLGSPAAATEVPVGEAAADLVRRQHSEGVRAALLGAWERAVAQPCAATLADLGTALAISCGSYPDERAFLADVAAWLGLPAPGAAVEQAPSAPQRSSHGPFAVGHRPGVQVHDIAAGALCPCLPAVLCCGCGEVVVAQGALRDRGFAPVARQNVPDIPRPMMPQPAARH